MTPAEMEQRIEELESLVRRLCKHTGMRMERLKDLDAKQRTLIPRKQQRLD
jgi:chaperonin cofactor prefoldin